MGETRFTKGPWRASEVEGPEESRWFIQFDGWLKNSTIAAMNGFCAAYSNAEADARLIAAAPELYEALAHQIYRNHGYSEVCDGCKAGSLALKKARGES